MDSVTCLPLPSEKSAHLSCPRTRVDSTAPMTREATDAESRFGYLSTWDSPEHGCLGGYLVVSPLGRPLEFHCTAPVKTSRAQQILYGPTLWPYVLGEQIGGTLLAQAKLRASVILVDHPAAFCLSSQLSTPMVRLHIAEGESLGASPSAATSANIVTVARFACEFAPNCVSDHEPVREALARLAQIVDLAEPFERIREAIREAQRIGASEQYDAYGNAA
jgi:hypothetical protein